MEHNDYSKSAAKKVYGGSSVTKIRGQGASSVIEWLFYFKPDTNGAAYVIMTRAENYLSCKSWSIKVTGTNYEGGDSGTDVDSYMHKVRVTGLTTGETYTIRMSWFTNDTNDTEYHAEITRTYYCSNSTPPNNPYSDGNGKTTVPSYSSSYPCYCVNVECSDNNLKTDDRCPYDATTRNLFWQVCATNYETHAIGSAMEFQNTCRWPPGTVYVKVTYKNTTNMSEISARINEWICWMNGLVGSAGVTFKLGSSTADNARQINVIVGTHSQLWGYNPDVATVETLVYGGTWQAVLWGDGIIEAEVKICCESRYPFNYCSPAFEGIVFEELTEASGPRYDQFGLSNTVFSEIAYPGKTIGGPPGESWTRDENVIKILYSIGYLKGYASPSYEYYSEFGSGIVFNKYYISFGALSSSSQSLFFQINATEGSITGSAGYTLPDSMYITYKNQRDYSLRAIYATEIPTSQKEQSSGLPFRYTNLSSEGNPYFNLPKNPNYTSIERVDSGYKVGVTGLNTPGEYYDIRAYLKDVADQDIEDGNYYAYTRSAYSKSSVSITGLQYGRTYSLYLYSDCGGAESDWVLIDEGTVAPKTPIISNTSHTDSCVVFTYDMGNTKFDNVLSMLYRDGVLVATNLSTAASKTVTLNFDTADGDYRLKVYSVVSANGLLIQCVDSSGNNDYAEYSFSIRKRKYFYWSDYTNEVKSGGIVANVSYTAWNAFVQNVYDTVCGFDTKDGYMPSNTSSYASGFGLAAGTKYETALLNYAMMSNSISGRTLTAERFNIVNYVISRSVSTDISYKYNKATSPTKVYASELITLQKKLNSI